jgi:hypothetical protein
LRAHFPMVAKRVPFHEDDSFMEILPCVLVQSRIPEAQTRPGWCWKVVPCRVMPSKVPFIQRIRFGDLGHCICHLKTQSRQWTCGAQSMTNVRALAGSERSLEPYSQKRRKHSNIFIHARRRSCETPGTHWIEGSSVHLDILKVRHGSDKRRSDTCAIAPNNRNDVQPAVSSGTCNENEDCQKGRFQTGLSPGIKAELVGSQISDFEMLFL